MSQKIRPHCISPLEQSQTSENNPNSTMKTSLTLAACLTSLGMASGYAFVARNAFPATTSTRTAVSKRRQVSSSLKMIDQQVLLGGGIAIAGLAAGIGLVAFTEQQGERAKERGGGLSESMSTRIAGGLLEDMEVSSVEDLGSLTSQLEKALKEAGGADEKELEMTEEAKKRILEEADDGW
jgi:hypothetical protein